MWAILAVVAGADPGEKADNLVDSVVEALPRLGVAVGVAVFAWLLSRVVRWGLNRVFCRSHTESFARVMSKLVGAVVLVVGVLIAATVAFPSVKPVDLLAGAGIFSVAIGFAFQDILENLLAGVLLLIRQPFESGDQIIVGESETLEGTVEGITIRETRIKTYDGRRLIIPNADVYKSALIVNTAFPARRSNFLVGVAYEADLDEARQVISDAVAGVDGVDSDRPIEPFLVELGASTINIDVRYWTESAQHDVREVQDRAVNAVKVALDEHGIEMPSEIIALQATSSFRAALQNEPVTPGGGVAG